MLPVLMELDHINWYRRRQGCFLLFFFRLWRACLAMIALTAISPVWSSLSPMASVLGPNAALLMEQFAEQEVLSLQDRLTVDLARGDFWATLPLRINLQSSSDGAKDEVTRAALLTAMNYWSEATGLQLWKIISSVNPTAVSDIKISWAKNFSQQTGHDDQGTMAVTIRSARPPLIQQAEVILNPNFLNTETVLALELVLIHELGHTMGLDHATNADSIMYRSINLSQLSGGLRLQELLPDDIEYMRELASLHEERQRQNPQVLAAKSTSANGQSTERFLGMKVNNCGGLGQEIKTLNLSASSTVKEPDLFLLSLFLGLLPFLISLFIKNGLHYLQQRKKSSDP